MGAGLSQEQKPEQGATVCSPSDVSPTTAVKSEGGAKRAAEKQGRKRCHDGVSIRPLSDPALEGSTKKAKLKQVSAATGSSAHIGTSATTVTFGDEETGADDNECWKDCNGASADSIPPPVEPGLKEKLEQVSPAADSFTYIDSSPTAVTSEDIETRAEIAAATAVEYEDEAERTAEKAGRERVLDGRALKLDALWIHPMGPQRETKALHRVRALLELTSLDKAAVSARTGISTAALSQYLRGQFPARLDEIESRLDIVVHEFLDGKHPVTNSDIVVNEFVHGKKHPVTNSNTTAPWFINRAGEREIAFVPARRRTNVVPATYDQYAPIPVRPPAQIGTLPDNRIAVGYTPPSRSAQGPNGLPYEQYRAAYFDDIQLQFERLVPQMCAGWKQPSERGGQEETLTLHRARALLRLTRMTQTFICAHSGITNTPLSQYLRFRFAGRQHLLEEKLERFIADYLRGKYYIDAYETNWFRYDARDRLKVYAWRSTHMGQK